MTLRQLTRPALAAALLTTFLLTPGPAAAQVDGMPEVQQSGQARYVTGGVGLDQSAAFKQAMRRYPLALQIARREAGRNVYTADAEVRIVDRSGQPVMEARTEGPFLLADVPDGSYQVEVTLDGSTQRQRVTVHDGRTAQAFFLFGREGS